MQGAATPEARRAFFNLSEIWANFAAEIENAQSMLGVTTPSVTGQIDLEVQISGNLIVVREPASLFYAMFLRPTAAKP